MAGKKRANYANKVKAAFRKAVQEAPFPVHSVGIFPGSRREARGTFGYAYFGDEYTFPVPYIMFQQWFPGEDEFQVSYGLNFEEGGDDPVFEDISLSANQAVRALVEAPIKLVEVIEG